MDDEQREFEKQKRGLLLTIMQAKFEDKVYAYLDSDKFESMDELDAWLSEALQQFCKERRVVREYYNSRIYS